MHVIESIYSRWSPREYLPKPVDLETVHKIFDAARWAQSCFNEQPWRYWIAPIGKSEGRRQLESLLVEGNAYAKQAGILGLALAKKTFAHDGKPNRWAPHDLGAASQLVALAARGYGLMTRFMGGFDAEKAKTMVPADVEPMAMFVIGYAPPDLNMSERIRNPVEDFVSIETFGHKFDV